MKKQGRGKAHYEPRRPGPSRPRKLDPLDVPSTSYARTSRDGNNNTAKTAERSRTVLALDPIPVIEIDRDRWRKQSKLLHKKTITEEQVDNLFKNQ